MKPFFAEDRYDTPENTPRYKLDRLMGNGRLYFHTAFFKTIIQSSRVAKKGLYDREAWARSSYQTFQLVEGCGGRFHITGLEYLRQPGPFVFVGNHMSGLETAVMPGIVAPYMPVTFVVKHTILDYPFFGEVVRATDPIPVGRVNPREDFQIVLQEGVKALQAGTSVVIYPQHTRTMVFRPEAFNSMGIKLAKKAGVSVLPVAVKTDFWDYGRILRDFGPIHRDRPIHIAFGEPFPIQNSKADHQRVIQFIQTCLQTWEQEDKSF